MKSIIGSFNNQKSEISKKSEFIDPLFPPSFDSLFSSKKEVVNYKAPTIPKFLKDKKKLLLSQFALTQKGERYSWAKLGEIKDSSKINVLKESKKLSDDVIQGELGDCYYLSVLAALSENPSNIKNLVQTAARGNDGLFETKVYIHGEPVSVIIDDQFPVANATKLAFAGINENSNNLWPAILEKAWAKCNKTYEDIIPGNSADAFEFLTPAPIDTYYHTPETTATLFNIIQEAQKKNYIVMADITETRNTNLELLSKMGLITNHAYSIISTAVLKKPNGSEIQLVKMKNLWGTNEWIGDWSDESLKWTQEFKRAVGLHQKEEGVFWMSFDDYIQFYTTTHICQIHSDYSYNVNKFKNIKPHNICKVIVEKSGSGYFIVNQKNTRIYSSLKNHDYQNAFCSVIVFRKEGDQYIFIGSDSGIKDRLYIECPEMEKGVYYISVSFPKTSKNFSLQNDFETIPKTVNFRVGLYSNAKDSKIQYINENEDISDFIFGIIADNAEKNNEKYIFAQEGEPNTWRTINFDNDKNGYGYIFYKNNSDAFLKERIEIGSLQNVNIIPRLKDGIFMVQKSEEDNEKSKPSSKPSSRQPTNKGKGAKKKGTEIQVESGEKVNEKIDYESENVSKTINSLKSLKMESSSEIVQGDTSKPINSSNKCIIQFNVAPHSSCAVFLQKTSDESDIDLSSDICFDYLPSTLLGEQKFSQKKYRLRYNNKPVEVYECIAEHNTGVFFQYKNRTSEFRVKVTAKFSRYDNLYLLITSSDLEEGKEMKLKNYVANKFREDNDDDFVTLVIEPGETGFFGLNAVDVFEKFSYSCQFDYHFSLFKISSNLFSSIEEGSSSIKKDEVKE